MFSVSNGDYLKMIKYKPPDIIQLARYGLRAIMAYRALAVPYAGIVAICQFNSLIIPSDIYGLISGGQ
jgi:hypothetical protein